MSENDDSLRWLMEQQIKSHLSWIGLWLVCLLGNVNILIEIASAQEQNVFHTHAVLILTIFVTLVSGMVFSVYRLSNNTALIMQWANQIENKFFKDQLLHTQGSLSRFFVDNKGKICTYNRFLAYVIHFVVFAILFGLAII